MKWRPQRNPTAACEYGPSSARRRVLTVPLVPEAVRRARRDTAMALSEYAIPTNSTFAGAVLLVVSELVTNAVRHAADRSPTADVTIAVGGGQLVVGVADQSPCLPDVSPGMTGEGLRTVAGLAAAYDGTLTVEPATHGCGKVVLAGFRIPEDFGPFAGRRAGVRAR
ncbi:ATP-binding protein [Streptomyces sp. NPDC046261]|uniref:ATP-binding protein n=1 Tax=Streptomyces sp. NPDC046261 TaxID=3157200 RepID=UPI0033FEA1C9